MIFDDSNNSSMTHVKKHKLYNVCHRAPQKTALFSPVALQPFYLLLIFTLKKNNYKIHQYCELPSWISIQRHLKESLARNLTLTATASRNVMRDVRSSWSTARHSLQIINLPQVYMAPIAQLVVLCSLYAPKIIEFHCCIQLLQAKMKGGIILVGPPCKTEL